jgi:hypothetical protein
MADEFITFKDDRIKREWESGKLDPTVQAIVRDASEFAGTLLQWPLTLTSIWRSQGEEKQLGGTSIHCFWRAVDIRTRDQDPAVVACLVAYLNGKYIYDATRPTKVVAYNKPHGTGPHCHIQSFPNRTTLRPTPRET